MRIGAGFTDILPATERKSVPGPVIDITGVDELCRIARTPRGLSIGAAVTWSDLMRADLPPALRGLQLAAREVGGRQIQNRGTIGGNLCNASPAADGVPPLLTLDATVELRSAGGQRLLPLDRFILGPRKTALAPDELLAAVHIPAAALEGESAFLKLGARSYLVISIAMVAARLVVRDGRVSEAAVAVGACGPVAARPRTLEGKLTGTAPTADTISDAEVAAALAPISDIRADAAYRSRAAAVLVRRAVGEAAARAGLG